MAEHTDPAPDTVDGEDPRARRITEDWMAHLGYTPEEIAAADAGPVHGEECEFHPGDYGWVCQGENGEDLHPDCTALSHTAELVMFVLEHSVLDAEVAALTAERDALVAQCAIWENRHDDRRNERDRLAEDYARVMTERDNAVAELAERTRQRDEAETGRQGARDGAEQVRRAMAISVGLPTATAQWHEIRQAAASVVGHRLTVASLEGQLLDVQRDCITAVRERDALLDATGDADRILARVAELDPLGHVTGRLRQAYEHLLADSVAIQDGLIRERDAALATIRAEHEAMEALYSRVTAERDAARADAERWLEVAHSHEMKLGAMRPVVDEGWTLGGTESVAGKRIRHKRPPPPDTPASPASAPEPAEQPDTQWQPGDPVYAPEARWSRCDTCGGGVLFGAGSVPTVCADDGCGGALVAAPEWEPETEAQGDDDAVVVQALLAAALTNLDTAHTDNERAEAIADLLEGWYDLWPDTAITSPHAELVRLLRVVDEAKARPLPTVGTDAVQDRTGALEAAIEAAIRGYHTWGKLLPSPEAMERAVRAAAPHIQRETLLDVRRVLEEHWLAEMICDHEGRRDNPRCACSRVHLGWHPTVGAAAQAWIDHVFDAIRAAPLITDPAGSQDETGGGNG